MNPVPAAIYAPAYLQVDLGRLMACIAQIEPFKGRRGPSGERGVLQFREETWREMTDLPFEDADDPKTCLEVGRFALSKYRTQLARQGIEPSVLNLALAWKAGINGVLLKKWLPRRDHNYAYRILNLYNSFP